MTVRDVWSQAEIMRRMFDDRSEFGGIYKDDYDTPILVWDSKPYYINKPGMSTQDFKDFVGEYAKYIPAAKLSSLATTLKGKLLSSFGLSAATETASEAAEGMLAPETAASKKRDFADVATDITTTAAVTAGIETGLPPALKLSGKVARAASAAGSRMADAVPNIADAMPEVAKKFKRAVDHLIAEPTAKKSKFPLLEGQRTSDYDPEVPFDVTRVSKEAIDEDIIRFGPEETVGPVAKQIIREADDIQLREIRQEADNLMEEFGPLESSPRTVGEVGERIQDITASRTERLLDEYRTGKEFIEKTEFPPVFGREGIDEIANELQEVIARDFPAETVLFGKQSSKMGTGYEVLSELKDKLKILSTRLDEGLIDDVPLEEMWKFQQLVNGAMRRSGNADERRIIGQMKGALDQKIYEAVERGIAIGDEETLETLKKITGIYRQAMQLSGKGAGKNAKQRSVNRILDTITDRDYTPDIVANKIFGHSKFVPPPVMKLVLKRLKENLPPEEAQEVMALIRNGILIKAFQGKKGTANRSEIVRNFKEIFEDKKWLMQELFSKEELVRLANFRKDVLPTILAEIKLNPSGTAYVGMAALTKFGLLSRSAPIIGETAKKAQQLPYVAKAYDSTRDVVLRNQRPLVVRSSAAAVRQTFEEEPESVQIENILEAIDPETAKKIIEAVGLP
jgi:hypothetical protein